MVARSDAAEPIAFLELIRKSACADRSALRGFAIMLRLLMQVCREELAKAKKLVVDSYATMREIDARTMEVLIALLQRPK